MGTALIKNGIVVNMVEIAPSNQAEMTALYEAEGYTCVHNATAEIGSTYEGGIFTPPVREPVVDPLQWLIDVGPFFDRFAAKKLSILMSTDPLVQAIIKDVQIRKWVDLQRTDVAQALDNFVSKSLITAEEKTTILTSPVQYVENLALRKTYFS